MVSASVVVVVVVVVSGVVVVVVVVSGAVVVVVVVSAWVAVVVVCSAVVAASVAAVVGLLAAPPLQPVIADINNITAVITIKIFFIVLLCDGRVFFLNIH